MIPLKDFLEVVTYNQLFHYVDLPVEFTYFIKEYEQGILDTSICYIEQTNSLACRVWYPYKAWIDECKRRQEEESIMQQLIENRKTAKVTLPKQEDLLAQLNKAILENNNEEIKRLSIVIASKLL